MCVSNLFKKFSQWRQWSRKIDSYTFRSVYIAYKMLRNHVREIYKLDNSTADNYQWR